MNDSILAAEPMGEEAIGAEMDEIQPGSRALIRYKETADPVVVAYLLGMVNSSIISASSGQMAVLLAIMATRDWKRAENRVVELVAKVAFDPEWFKGRVLREIDYIKVCQV